MEREAEKCVMAAVVGEEWVPGWLPPIRAGPAPAGRGVQVNAGYVKGAPKV